LKGGLLNIALLVLGLLAAVLIYALVSRMLSPTVDVRREGDTAGLVGDIIQVEVRNGCGIAGLAGDVTRFLRRTGFDVVEVGDYTTFTQEHSIIIDRVGNLESARKVAAAMGIPEDRIQQDIQPDLYLDASVIIGLDYQTLKPFRQD
jgi:hypothetical protein